jgi:hypothetical protein
LAARGAAELAAESLTPESLTWGLQPCRVRELSSKRSFPPTVPLLLRLLEEKRPFHNRKRMALLGNLFIFAIVWRQRPA